MVRYCRLYGAHSYPHLAHCMAALPASVFKGSRLPQQLCLPLKPSLPPLAIGTQDLHSALASQPSSGNPASPTHTLPLTLHFVEMDATVNSRRASLTTITGLPSRSSYIKVWPAWAMAVAPLVCKGQGQVPHRGLLREGTKGRTRVCTWEARPAAKPHAALQQALVSIVAGDADMALSLRVKLLTLLAGNSP